MREELITDAIRKMVDDGSLAGAVTLVWQDGKVIQAAGVGWRDIASNLPMERNTLLPHCLNDKADYIYGGTYVIG